MGLPKQSIMDEVVSIVTKPPFNMKANPHPISIENKVLLASKPSPALKPNRPIEIFCYKEDTGTSVLFRKQDNAKFVEPQDVLFYYPIYTRNEAGVFFMNAGTLYGDSGNLTGRDNRHELLPLVLSNLQQNAIKEGNIERGFSRIKTVDHVVSVADQLKRFMPLFDVYNILIERDPSISWVQRNIDLAMYCGATDDQIVMAKIKNGISVDPKSISDDVMMELI